MYTFHTLSIHMNISHIVSFPYHALLSWKKIFPFPGTAAIIASPVVLTLVSYQDMGKYQVTFTWGMAG